VVLCGLAARSRVHVIPWLGCVDAIGHGRRRSHRNRSLRRGGLYPYRVWCQAVSSTPDIEFATASGSTHLYACLRGFKTVSGSAAILAPEASGWAGIRCIGGVPQSAEASRGRHAPTLSILSLTIRMMLGLHRNRSLPRLALTHHPAFSRGVGLMSLMPCGIASFP
jgi:hypothetical protein